jgi:hypothetical protein
VADADDKKQQEDVDDIEQQEDSKTDQVPAHQRQPNILKNTNPLCPRT